MVQSRVEKLSSFLFSLSVADWGIADISGLHPLSEAFPKALSVLVPYSPGFKDYTEKDFHNTLKKVNALTDDILSEISGFFQSERIKYRYIPQGGQDPESLLALFPHKLAAVRAGLGWIGKSSLLITRKYGPRVRLSTVLIDWDILCSEPVVHYFAVSGGISGTVLQNLSRRKRYDPDQ